MATKDPLTGILNRRGLSENPELILRENAKKEPDKRNERKKDVFSVLVFDMDNFKIVNDAYSHQDGDKLLVEVANRLRTITRSNDLICRWGGDEFVVMFKGATPQDIINKLYDKPSGKAIIGIQTEIEGNMENITISGGVIELQSDETIEQAVARADTLLYEVKNGGKGRIGKEEEIA